MPRRLGKCTVCGAPHASHETALELLLGVRVVVCLGACQAEFDARLEAAVRVIAEELKTTRENALTEGRKPVE